MDPVLKAALAKVSKALRRLNDTQGTVARRNARRAVGAAVRVLNMRVDEKFPRLSTAKPYKPGKMSKTARLQARGYAPLAVNSLRRLAALGAFAEAGVRVRRVEDALWVPAWANLPVWLGLGPMNPNDVAEAVKVLRRAKTDREFRTALSTANGLGFGAGS